MWKKNDAEVQQRSLVMREWLKTPSGLAYNEARKAKNKAKRETRAVEIAAGKKKAYQKVRLEAMQHYTDQEVPTCACPGCDVAYLPCLTFDHIKGDGAAHRREIGMTQSSADQMIREGRKASVGGNGFAYWLKKNGWPGGIQVLCQNCNFAKKTDDHCPIHP